VLNGFFITGTDTGVGKTILTASLLAAARRRGLLAAPMKPIQTGCHSNPRGLRAPDLDLCLAWAGMTATPAEYRRMAPYRYLPACSPHLAARQAQYPICLAPILDAAAALAQTYAPLLVEGAGGVLVPLNDSQTMLDLMAALQLPVVVAARPGLGTINHTLLTLHAIRHAGLPVAGVVLVAAAPTPTAESYIEADNREAIAARGGILLGVLPYSPQPAAAEPDPPCLRDAADAILDALLATPP
jgi:dethiobiotin synthase